MKNQIIKLIIELFGIFIFIYCIINEISGIGRAFLIFTGTLFCLLGCLKK